MGCFSSEPTRVEKFWDQYKESEYSKNVLEFDWRNWLSQPRDGVALHETDFSSELNPEYLMRGLVEMDGAWLWETPSQPIPDGIPAWSLRGTAGSMFVRQARTSTAKPANSAASASARVASKPLSAASDSQTPPRARRTQNTASASASATAPSPITSSSARPTGTAPTTTSTNTTSTPVTRPIYGPPRPPASPGLKKASLLPKTDHETSRSQIFCKYHRRFDIRGLAKAKNNIEKIKQKYDLDFNECFECSDPVSSSFHVYVYYGSSTCDFDAV
ncbi:peroxiredoxin q [Lentinula edodes]|uniref:Peroxiredoxin q n=1 Tax=Lentinula edodes TaxID=5353 RepID=A0A1Q3E2Y3_LENED|nr:peroxiredoxin q [Lentinula edodes]